MRINPHLLVFLLFLPSQTGYRVPSAARPMTQRLTSQKWRAATASVHSAGQMNSCLLLRSHTARPASVLPVTFPCPSATTWPPFPFTPTTTITTAKTAGLHTVSRGESTSRSKERSVQNERKPFRGGNLWPRHTGETTVLYFLSCCRAGGGNCQNRKVTDYYPIRRSSRKSNTELKVSWSLPTRLNIRALFTFSSQH